MAWGGGNPSFSPGPVSHSHAGPCTCGLFEMTESKPGAWRSPPSRFSSLQPHTARLQPRKCPGHSAQHSSSKHPAVHTGMPATVPDRAAPPTPRGLAETGERMGTEACRAAHGGLEPRLAALAPSHWPLPTLDLLPRKKQ